MIYLHSLPDLLPLGFLRDISCPTECCEADAVERAFRPDLSVSSIFSDVTVLKQMSTCSTPEMKHFLVKKISIHDTNKTSLHYKKGSFICSQQFKNRGKRLVSECTRLQINLDTITSKWQFFKHEENKLFHIIKYLNYKLNNLNVY